MNSPKHWHLFHVAGVGPKGGRRWRAFNAYDLSMNRFKPRFQTTTKQRALALIAAEGGTSVTIYSGVARVSEVIATLTELSNGLRGDS